MKLSEYSCDTHTLIWYFRKVRTLSSNAKSILHKIFTGETKAAISTMVLLEVFDLSLRDKTFEFKKFISYLSESGFEIVSLDEDILRICFKLPRGINIHDRVIIATALYTKTKLITKDRNLRNLFPATTVW